MSCRQWRTPKLWPSRTISNHSSTRMLMQESPRITETLNSFWVGAKRPGWEKGRKRYRSYLQNQWKGSCCSGGRDWTQGVRCPGSAGGSVLRRVCREPRHLGLSGAGPGAVRGRQVATQETDDGALSWPSFCWEGLFVLPQDGCRALGTPGAAGSPVRHSSMPASLSIARSASSSALSLRPPGSVPQRCS